MFAVCQCLGGRTGLSCEVEPSMSNLEGDGATKILTVVALNASSGAAINAVDQNLTTFWEVSAEDGDAWLVFDLGMPLRLLGLAIRNKYRVGPARNEYVLQFSANDEFGPWSDALNFRPQHSLDWQYFSIQPELPTRYVYGTVAKAAHIDVDQNIYCTSLAFALIGFSIHVLWVMDRKAMVLGSCCW